MTPLERRGRPGGKGPRINCAQLLVNPGMNQCHAGLVCIFSGRHDGTGSLLDPCNVSAPHRSRIMTLTRALSVRAVALGIFFAIDLVWLCVVAKNFYRDLA